MARCLCCGEAEANTRHARLSHRSGAQVNQHQPLVQALSRTLEIMPIRHQVESGAPFHPGRDLRMDIVIEASGLQDATASEYHATNRYSSASRMRSHKREPTCGQAARIETDQRLPLPRRASNHYAGPGQVSFDERSYKLVTVAVEHFGSLGKESSGLIDQVAAKHRWMNGRIVPSAERREQRAIIPNHLCDHSGHDFAQSSSI